VLEDLGDALAAVHAPDRLTRIGIDGVDGAGKTSLAEETAQLLTRATFALRKHVARRAGARQAAATEMRSRRAPRRESA
jgi:thymidylate kinase